MARQLGTFNLSSNLEPQVAAPLDSRLVVEYKTDLTDPSAFPYCYEGMAVSVKSEKRMYMLSGSDPTVLTNWTDMGPMPDHEEMSFNEIKDIWDQVFNQS